MAKKGVRALDFGTNIIYIFSEKSRFTVNPSHLFSPPNFADETAIQEWDLLKNAKPDDVIYIEWACDRFYSLNIDTGEYVRGPTVWRKSKVMG